MCTYRSNNKRTGPPLKNDKEIFDKPFPDKEDAGSSKIKTAEFVEQWVPIRQKKKKKQWRDIWCCRIEICNKNRFLMLQNWKMHWKQEKSTSWDGKKTSPIIRPPMRAKHRGKRVQWAKRHMKLPTKNILFTGEARTTLNGPFNWSKGWVVFGHQRPTRIRRQQGSGSIIIWAGIINDQIACLVRFPEGVKLTSVTDPVGFLMVDRSTRTQRFVLSSTNHLW